MTRAQATKTRKELERQITRASLIAEQCLSQLADGDLSIRNRIEAESRAKLATRTGKELEAALSALEDKLKASKRAERRAARKR